MHEKLISIKEMCQIMALIDEAAKSFKAEEGSETEEKLYQDIYRQALREAGVYSLELIPEMYLDDICLTITDYELPSYLLNELEAVNESEMGESHECGNYQ